MRSTYSPAWCSSLPAPGVTLELGSYLMTLTKPSVAAPRPRRSRAAAPAQQPVSAPLTPDRIGFVGTASGSTDGGRSIHVQALCWPIMPMAWTALTRTWEVLRAGREETDVSRSAAAKNASWVTACAPQLGAPFRDTAAQESSVAAFLSRTSMQVAVTVLEVPRNSPAIGADAAQRQSLSGCLAVYDQFGRAPGRRRCSTLVVRSIAAKTDLWCLEEFVRCRTNLPDADWLRDMQLRFWNGSVEPLPLELAHVVAASIVRHRLDEDAPNPIFDAALTKLAQVPFALPRSSKSKRR